MTTSLQGTRFGRAVVAFAGLFLAVGAAQAAGPMATGGLTSQPIGHYEFCKVNQDECSIRSRDVAPETYSTDLFKTVTAVNVSVNKSIRPMNDFDIYGRDEVWAYPDSGVGDCEDYVLEKRRELNARGLSFANLLITVVRKPDGEGHAILTVRTDRGDYVLDNLSDRVRSWNDTGYRFLKRQSSEHSGRWVSIREGQNTLVGSVQ